MRHLSLLPLILALACLLVACGGTQAPASGDPNATNGTDNVVISAAVGGPTGDPATTPQASPTPLPSLGLTVENLQHEAQGNGSVSFSAQVVNLGTEEVYVAKVVVELFDANGERITRMSFSNPGLPTLKPGEGATWTGQRGGLEIEWVETRASAVGEPVTAAR